MSLARASALQFGVNIGETLVGALVTLYFVNELGVAAFGSYALALALVNWVLIPTGGIHSATMKRMSEGTRVHRLYTGGILLQTAFGGVVVLAFALAAEPIARFVGFDGVPLLAGFVVLKGFGSFFLQALRGVNRLEVASLIQGSWNILRSVAQAVLVFFGAGVRGLVGGEIIGAAVAVVITLVALRTDVSLTPPSRTDLQRLYAFGRYSWLGTLKTMSFSWMDTLVLGFFPVGNAVIGAYEVAWRISELFILLPNAIATSVFPAISKHVTEGRFSDIERLLDRAIPMAGLLAIPGFVGALAVGEGVLSLYGSSVTAVPVAVPALVVLSGARIFQCYELMLLQSLNALDYPDRAFRIDFVFLLLNLLLNLALVSVAGAVGAAVATLLSVVVGVALALRVFPSEISLARPWRPIGVQVGAALVMGGALFVLVSAAPASSVLRVLAYVAGGALLYFVVVSAFSSVLRDRIRQTLTETLGE